jgi:GNAT superfamily N-acetyltransferase
MMDCQINIRKAAAADAAAISKILREVGWFDWINQEDQADTEERIAAAIQEWSSDHNRLALLAEDGSGVPVGYAFAHCNPYMMLPGPEMYLSELFVRKTWRGKGVGRALLGRVESFARSRGCSRLMVVTGKHRESYARGFYSNCGWVERPYIANFILPLDDRLKYGTRS